MAPEKKSKVTAFRCTDMYGGQYRAKDGIVVLVSENEVITDAIESEMYITTGTKKKVRFGFEEIKDYLPPATPLDVKLAESQEVKRLADENAELRKQLDKKEEEDAEDPKTGPPPAAAAG